MFCLRVLSKTPLQKRPLSKDEPYRTTNSKKSAREPTQKSAKSLLKKDSIKVLIKTVKYKISGKSTVKNSFWEIERMERLVVGLGYEKFAQNSVKTSMLKNGLIEKFVFKSRHKQFQKTLVARELIVLLVTKSTVQKRCPKRCRKPHRTTAEKTSEKRAKQDGPWKNY